MASLHTPKLVNDIFTRTFVIPEAVSFLFIRKPNGDRYIACIPTVGVHDTPLFISVEEFLRIIDIVEEWVKAEYVISDTSSHSEISIRNEGESGINRIDVVFSYCDSVKSIDVRNYWKPYSANTFIRTRIGFCLHSHENITTLLKIKEEILMHLDNVDILDELIHLAYGLFYKIYTEVWGKPYNRMYISLLTTTNVDTFTSLWHEKMQSIEPEYAEEWVGASRDIYSYVISKGIEALETYIENAQFQLHPMCSAQMY